MAVTAVVGNRIVLFSCCVSFLCVWCGRQSLGRHARQEAIERSAPTASRPPAAHPHPPTHSSTPAFNVFYFGIVASVRYSSMCSIHSALTAVHFSLKWDMRVCYIHTYIHTGHEKLNAEYEVSVSHTLALPTYHVIRCMFHSTAYPYRITPQPFAQEPTSPPPPPRNGAITVSSLPASFSG